MAFDDKVGNKAEELGGKVKEGAGNATDDKSLEAEGKADQGGSKLKQADENVKDALGPDFAHQTCPQLRDALRIALDRLIHAGTYAELLQHWRLASGGVTSARINSGQGLRIR